MIKIFNKVLNVRIFIQSLLNFLQRLLKLYINWLIEGLLRQIWVLTVYWILSCHYRFVFCLFPVGKIILVTNGSRIIICSRYSLPSWYLEKRNKIDYTSPVPKFSKGSKRELDMLFENGFRVHIFKILTSVYHQRRQSASLFF